MFNTSEGAASAYSSSVWGIIIFLLILFWVFGSRNGNGWGNGWGNAMPFGFGNGGWWGNNEHTPKDNDRHLSDIKATMDKDTAVLEGQLDTAFREVINNANTNTGRVLEALKDQYISQLERENTKLYITSQNDQIKGQIVASNDNLNHRLDIIQGNMISRPPFYPSGCVPCVTNCCGGNSGCGCNS